MGGVEFFHGNGTAGEFAVAVECRSRRKRAMFIEPHAQKDISSPSGAAGQTKNRGMALEGLDVGSTKGFIGGLSAPGRAPFAESPRHLVLQVGPARRSERVAHQKPR